MTLRRRLAEHRWWLLLGCAALAAGLGAVGYLRLDAGPDFDFTPLDVAYHTLRLFLIDVSAEQGPLPWELELARWLAPAVAAWSALLALGELFREEARLLRLRWLRGHVVVCGADRKGERIARAYLQGEAPGEGRAVVVVERNPDAPGLAALRELGATVVVGDAGDPLVLAKARAPQAAAVFALCGESGANAEVAAVLVDEVGGREPPLSVLCHIADASLREALRPALLGGLGARGGVCLELLHLDAVAARELLDCPRPLAARGDRPPHLAVIGTGRLADPLVLRAAREHQLQTGEGGPPLAVTVLAPQAEGFVAELRRRHPGIEAAVEFAALAVAEPAAPAAVADSASAALARHDIRADRLLVCCATEAESLVALRHLAPPPTLAGERPEMVGVVDDESGLPRLLGGRLAEEGKRLFAVLDRLADPALYATTTERLARSVHEQWMEARPAGERVPWQQASAAERASSRAAVEHYRAHLRAEGLTVEPWVAWPGLVPGDDAVERLAAAEHRRWRAEREAQGWRPGPERDDARRTNPLLVDWDALPEDAREANRTFWRRWPVHLADNELQLARLPAGEA